MYIRNLKCFKQVAKVIGHKGAVIELESALSSNSVDFNDAKNLSFAFLWHETPQGYEFWRSIARKIKPHYKWDWKSNKPVFIGK